MAAKLRVLGCFGLCVGLMAIEGVAYGQVQQASYQPSRQSQKAQRMTPAMQYFSRGRRVPMKQHQARRPAATSQQVPQTVGKPFQHVDNRPNLSPYLSLDMVQTNEGIPNYYSRVLPQIEQQESTAKQAAELRRLQQQLRLANAPGLNLNSRNAGVPTTGSSSQFMNRGNYFPTMKR